MRPLARRRGVTLLELLLAITLLALFGAMVTTVLVAASRVAGRATTHLALERTAQTVHAFLGHELRNADWGGVVVGADAITLSRSVGAAEPCSAQSGAVVVGRAAWDGDRAPEAGRDRLAVLDHPAGTWRDGPLTAVAPAGCPDGSPAWRLVSEVVTETTAQLRVVEEVVLRRYRSGSAEWLGLAPADGASPVQPFAGPLVPESSRFARVGDLLQLDLVATGGARTVRVPLGAAP